MHEHTGMPVSSGCATFEFQVTANTVAVTMSGWWLRVSLQVKFEPERISRSSWDLTVSVQSAVKSSAWCSPPRGFWITASKQREWFSRSVSASSCLHDLLSPSLGDCQFSGLAGRDSHDMCNLATYTFITYTVSFAYCIQCTCIHHIHSFAYSIQCICIHHIHIQFCILYIVYMHSLTCFGSLPAVYIDV